MVPAHIRDVSYDPVEMLDGILERAWKMLCETFDASAELPDMPTLFFGTSLSNPDLAAQTVLINMIMEIMEHIGRFSPWYRMTARAYGLTSVRDSTTNQTHWMLAPEAVQKWKDILETLSLAIEKNSGLIQAMVLVEELMSDQESDPCITAKCSCTPPRMIRLERSIFHNTAILCNLCQQPFEQVEQPK